MRVFTHADLIGRVAPVEKLFIMSMVSKAIRTQLLQCKDLTVHLHFKWNISASTLTNRLQAMRQWSKDVKLSVSFSDNIYGLSMSTLLRELTTVAPQLTSWSNMAGYFTTQHLEMLKDIILQATSLQHLRLFHLSSFENPVVSTYASQFAQALGGGESLVHLDLSMCFLQDRAIKDVGDVLSRMVSLQQLDLAHNKISIDGAVNVVRGLSKRATIHRLNFSSNRLRFGPTYPGQMVHPYDLNDTQLRLFADNLAACSSLSSLNLARNSINDLGAMRLGIVLHKCHALQTLNLSSNYMFKRMLTSVDEPGVMHLMSVLGDLCTSSLTHLTVNHNNLNINWGGLEQLERQGQTVKVEDYCPLHVLLRNLQGIDGGARLKQFDLRGNQLGDSDIVVLMRNVHLFPSITHLDLSNNDFNGCGFTALSNRLPEMPVLRLLDLSENLLCRHSCHSVRSEDQIWTVAHSFIQALALCTSLRNLSLRRCLRHQTLMDIFSQNLSSFTTLCVLDLSGNHVYLDAVERMTSVLASTVLTSLRHLDVYVDYEYAHSKAIAREWEAQWQHMTALEHLRYSDNSIVASKRRGRGGT